MVVARPHGSSGITAESKLEDGTHISTDPGGELDIPCLLYTSQGSSVKVRVLSDFFVYRARYNSMNYFGDFVATFILIKD